MIVLVGPIPKIIGDVKFFMEISHKVIENIYMSNYCRKGFWLCQEVNISLIWWIFKKVVVLSFLCLLSIQLNKCWATPSWTYSWYREAFILVIFSQFGCFFVYVQLNAGSPVWMRYRGWRQTLLMTSQNSLLHVKGQPLLVGQLCPFKVRANIVRC